MASKSERGRFGTGQRRYVATPIPDDIVYHPRVGMNDYLPVEILSTDARAHTVSTRGRSGCDSTLIWTVNPDGKDQLLLTHYSPTLVKDHLNVLRQFAPRGEGDTTSVIVTVDNDGDLSAPLEAAVEEITGVTPDIVRLPMPTKEDIGVLSINPLYLQLTAIRGYHGDPNMRRIIIPGKTVFRRIYDSTFTPRPKDR